MCDDVTEQEVASGSVCDHNPELCDVTEYVASSAADGADPFVLSDPPESNDWSVWEHNPPELCDVTQFEVATTPEDDTTVRDRQLKEKRDRSKLDYHEKNLAKSRKYRATNKQKVLVYSKEYHASHHEERLEAFKNNYIANREERLDAFREHYIANREERLDAFRDNYIANHEDRLEKSKDCYASNLEERKKTMNDYYASHSQQIKDNARAAVADTKNAKLRQKYRIKHKLHVDPPTKCVSAKK